MLFLDDGLLIASPIGGIEVTGIPRVTAEDVCGALWLDRGRD